MKFSFDMPCKSQVLTKSSKDGLVLQETKVLRFNDGRSISLRDVGKVSFSVHKVRRKLKMLPTDEIEMVIWPRFIRESDSRYMFVLSLNEAMHIYKLLFDEFFGDADLAQVQTALELQRFPLTWCQDIEGWQPLTSTVAVEKSVCKNW